MNGRVHRDDPTRSPVDLAFVRFVFGIAGISAVRRISYTSGRQGPRLWVFLEQDDRAAEDRIYDLEEDYLADEAAQSIDLHVVPLDRLREDNLPHLETLIER